MKIKTYHNQDFQIIREDDNTVHDRALKYCKEHPEASYRESVIAVLRADAELARKYYGRSEEPKESTEGCIEAKSYSQAKDSLHDQAMELKVARGIGYSEALHEVMQLPRNKLLVRKYVANSARRTFDSE